MIKQIPGRPLAYGLTRDLHIPASIILHHTEHQVFADVSVDRAAAVRDIKGQGVNILVFSFDNEVVKKDSRNRN